MFIIKIFFPVHWLSAGVTKSSFGTLQTRLWCVVLSFVLNTSPQPLSCTDALLCSMWFLSLREGQKVEKCFLLTFAVPNLTTLSSQSPLLSDIRRREKKKRITADQMGTFHMTKPINHLGGTQVHHSRAATHHFTVYRPQTHGHQSMAPRGRAHLPYPTGSWLMTS